MSSSAHGHFVWHDLITTDTQAAIKFYTKIIGWKTQPFDPQGKYMMWTGKDGGVGGVGAVHPDDQPYWRAYIGTDDIEATVYEAQQLGGAVVIPISDIPNVGRWATLRDPQGNEFGVFWAKDAPAPTLKFQPGEFHWHELGTSDYKTLFPFYQKLFGWQHGRDHDMGGMGMYSMFTHTGRPHGMGGMFNTPTGMSDGWVTYTQVDDAKKAAATITKLGGKTLHKPMQVPGDSWVVKFTDPQGIPHAVTSADKPAVKNGTKKKPTTKSKAKKTASKSGKAPAKRIVKKKSLVKSAKPKAATKKKKVVAKKSAKKVSKKKPSGKKKTVKAKRKK